MHGQLARTLSSVTDIGSLGSRCLVESKLVLDIVFGLEFIYCGCNVDLVRRGKE